MRKRFDRRKSFFLTAIGALMLVLVAIGIVATLFVLTIGRQMLSDSGVLPGVSAAEGTSPNVERKPWQLIPTWVGTDRVTILLLGIDERQQESGPWRTDTMILVTLDPVTMKAGILSIPRDLWVPIPDVGNDQPQRINTAHFLGDLYDYPGGGPALAMKTVEYNFGIPVDYYVRINFQGFIKLIDLIGGIDVYVDKPINDPTYPDNNYGYDPLYIEPGWHHFDGEMALKYARSRHGSSDFDRARRQQQVILAALDRVASLDLLPQLAKNADEIYATLEDSVSSNMTLDEMLALGNLALQVDREHDIRYAVIDQSCTQNWVTPDGAQVLIPIRERIREVRDYVFWETDEDILQQQAEEAAIELLNGTTRIGLAATTSHYLEEEGLTIAHFDNADRQDYAQTMIIVNRPKPQTVARLQSLLGIPAEQVVNGSDPASPYDLIVILGADYAGPPATPAP